MLITARGRQVDPQPVGAPVAGDRSTASLAAVLDTFVAPAQSSEPATVPPVHGRIQTDGRHLTLHGRPHRLRGVTYGSFAPRRDGQLFPEPAQVLRDLNAMAALGLNLLRTYTVPPVELLDTAAELGLHVLVGLHYDDWRSHTCAGRRSHSQVLSAGRRAVAEAIERLHGRAEVLAVSVGNEVPADLVRLHGAAGVERVLNRLVQDVHEGDEHLLATYSNFPTTEFLELPEADLVCYNVFLEQPERLRAYLRHLQVVAGPRPLLLTELGLAGDVHGEQAQAESLEWQLAEVDEAGCAGGAVFAWTDEWAVNGSPVEGWGFGITTVERQPKPAAAVVRRWTRRSLRDLRPVWPSVSVVVCAYNEERLIGGCLDSLAAVEYPGLEVVLCDDGSDDATLDIMRRYPFAVLALPHAGLSAARNAGLAAAGGTVVAYLDADARCHPDWPYHLALSLEGDDVVATGGPNLPVPGVGFVEHAVAASPGGPTEVLTGDDRAEHVPGCNMAFRADALRAVGGFDVVFTAAGDDVDVCWKLLDRGGQIAFSPAAQVRHHRRSSAGAYLRQQRSYGRAERMVAARHPHRFNRLGQARWSGFIYGGVRPLPMLLRPVVYHGAMGMAPYQPVVRRRGEELLGLCGALLPLVAPLAVLGLVLAPLSDAALAAPAVAATAVLLYVLVVAAAASPPRGTAAPLRWRLLVALLHVAQPLVRTAGRLRAPHLEPPSADQPDWSGDRGEWLRALVRDLSRPFVRVRCGHSSVRWDLAVSAGPLVRAEVTTAVAWAWTPVAAVRFRPRGSAKAALLLVLLLIAHDVPPLAPLLALAAVCAAEAVVLKRLLHRSLERTTSPSGLTPPLYSGRHCA